MAGDSYGDDKSLSSSSALGKSGDISGHFYNAGIDFGTSRSKTGIYLVAGLVAAYLWYRYASARKK